MKVIKQIQLGRKEDKLFVNVGQTHGVSLGHGPVMRRYDANVDPDRTRLGIQADDYNDYGGAETFIADLAFQSQLFGVLGFVKPFSLFSQNPVARTFSLGLPDVGLTGESTADARLVLDASRRGRVFSSIDALAGPVGFAFTASNANRMAAMGEEVTAKGAMTFHVRSNAPDGVTVSLLRDGRPIHTVSGPHLEYQSSDAGVYRVEMQWPGAPGVPTVPWVVSNPIYVRSEPRPADTVVASRAPRHADVRYSNGPATQWHIENSPQSRGALDVVSAVGGGTQLLLRYALGGTEGDGPYVALAMAVPEGLANYDRVTFNAQSSRPARIWVQLRVPKSGQGQSWHRSVYVDETPRTISVAFDDLRPLEATTIGGPVLADVRDVLFVVDTIHTRPGMNGQFLLDVVTLAR